MEEATGVPAAAGLLMLAENQIPEKGVITPEYLDPASFFAALRRVSVGGGGLELHRLVDGAATDRVRIRDLVAGTVAGVA